MERFGPIGRRAVEEDRLRISPAVILEIEFLREIGRVQASPDEVVIALSAALQLTVCQLSFQLVAMAACKEVWTRDPFDRVITAQARIGGGRLLSRDRRIPQPSTKQFGEHRRIMMLRWRMRTTINLPDDVYRTAYSLAQYEKVSLGEALARLVRQNATSPRVESLSGSFPHFKCSTASRPITLEETLAAEDDDL